MTSRRTPTKLDPDRFIAKRKSRWPCDACVIHARFARDEILNLAARRFARNNYSFQSRWIVALGIFSHYSPRFQRTRSVITPEAWTPVIINSQCSSNKWIGRSTKYVLPRIQVFIYIPIHLSCPFLKNPCLQTHSKDLSVLSHSSLVTLQLWDLFLHSSMSANQN